jgi:hypothetical protein
MKIFKNHLDNQVWSWTFPNLLIALSQSTKLLFHKHVVIINLIQSAEILGIQILTVELKIKNKIIIQHWDVEREKVLK